MATSARFFEVQLRDGHGPYTLIFPAQSRADLDLNLQIPSNEVLISIQNLNFFPVQTWHDDENHSVKFRTFIKGRWWRYWLGDLGHDYLLRQFSADAKEIFSELDKQYLDDD
jgi:hypothetical protein